MSSNSKKRQSAGSIYEDEPNKRQRRSVLSNCTATPKSLTSTAIKNRQNTLTQIGWIPSSRVDENDIDLGYERGSTESRRRSTRKGKPKLVQSETITQMDFLSPTVHDERGVELEDDELADTTPAPSRKKKRQEPIKRDSLARAVQTGRAKGVIASEAEAKAEEGQLRPKASASQTTRPVEQPASSTTTPRHQNPHIRMGEVPSSQSPPDSPLSTQSRKFVRHPSRTPLQERSLNIQSRRGPVGKGVLFPRKLEIADSMDSDPENSQTPTQARPTSVPSQHCYMPPSVRIRTDSQLTDVKGLAPMSQGHTVDAESSVASTHIPMKSEVQDSTDDESDGLETTMFSTGAETQAAYAAIISSPDGLRREQASLIIEAATPMLTEVRDFAPAVVNEQRAVEDVMDQEQFEHSGRAASELSIPDVNETLSNEDSDTRPDVSDYESEHISDTPKAASISHAKATTTQNPPNSFHPILQPLVPETESQFEDAWRTISPPPLGSPEMIPSSQPSEQDPPLDGLTSPPSPSPFKIPPVPPRLEPSSPSQATTTDSTQLHSLRCTQASFPNIPHFSPTRAPSSPSQATTTDSSQPPPAPPLPLQRRRTMSADFLSSPPPPPSLPPLSSSPLHTRDAAEGEIWMGYAGGWNGKRRTESQLLPDSLMNETLVGPPAWDTQESLDETCE